jgi:hypothetical protein
MIPENKIRVIHQQLKNGEPEGEVREKLKQEGYSEEEIQQVFRPHKYDMRSWYLVFAIVITLAGIYELINGGSFIIILLGGLLFLAYSNELKRLGKEK